MEHRIPFLLQLAGTLFFRANNKIWSIRVFLLVTASWHILNIENLSSKEMCKLLKERVDKLKLESASKHKSKKLQKYSIIMMTRKTIRVRALEIVQKAQYSWRKLNRMFCHLSKFLCQTRTFPNLETFRLPMEVNKFFMWCVPEPEWLMTRSLDEFN